MYSAVKEYNKTEDATWANHFKKQVKQNNNKK